jgi:hypothetical protein
MDYDDTGKVSFDHIYDQPDPRAYFSTLRRVDYCTVGFEHVFKQRRFASAAEQAHVLGNLAEVGVDPRGLEAEGWLYARLFVSCPRGEAGQIGSDLGRGAGQDLGRDGEA